MYKVFIIVHRSWGWTLGGQSLSFSKWHGLWKPWWPMNSGVFLFLSVLFTSYYANFQTTWSREDSAMNPQLPIIRTQRLSRFCHVCFVYPLLNISFFFCWNILRQIQLLHHSTPASSSMHWLKKKKKRQRFSYADIMPVPHLTKWTLIPWGHLVYHQVSPMVPKLSFL